MGKVVILFSNPVKKPVEVFFNNYFDFWQLGSKLLFYTDIIHIDYPIPQMSSPDT